MCFKSYPSVSVLQYSAFNCPHLSNEQRNQCRFRGKSHLMPESMWDSGNTRIWPIPAHEWAGVDKSGDREQSLFKERVPVYSWFCPASPLERQVGNMAARHLRWDGYWHQNKEKNNKLGCLAAWIMGLKGVRISTSGGKSLQWMALVWTKYDKIWI